MTTDALTAEILRLAEALARLAVRRMVMGEPEAARRLLRGAWALETDAEARTRGER